MGGEGDCETSRYNLPTLVEENIGGCSAQFCKEIRSSSLLQELAERLIEKEEGENQSSGFSEQMLGNLNGSWRNTHSLVPRKRE